MSNVTAVTHLLPTANEGFITTLGSTISSGAATVPLTSVTGLTNGTTFVGIIEPGQTNQQTFTGIVDTGSSSITGVKWTRGTNVSHSGGASIVDYVTGTALNMITKAIAREHNDDGTHSSITATYLALAGDFVQSSGNFTVPAGAVKAAALATDSILLAKSTVSGTMTASYSDLSGSANTVTVPAGGRQLRVTLHVFRMTNVSGADSECYAKFLQDGTDFTSEMTGAYLPNGKSTGSLQWIYYLAATAGSHAYKAQVRGAGTGHSIGNGFITIEMV